MAREGDNTRLPFFRAAPIGGLSRRQGGGRDNGKKELPSDPAAVAALSWPWTLASPTPHKPPVGEHAGGSVELGGACLGPGGKESSTKGAKKRR